MCVIYWEAWETFIYHYWETFIYHAVSLPAQTTVLIVSRAPTSFCHCILPRGHLHTCVSGQAHNVGGPYGTVPPLRLGVHTYSVCVCV
jgi:hypothetical protein